MFTFSMLIFSLNLSSKKYPWLKSRQSTLESSNKWKLRPKYKKSDRRVHEIKTAIESAKDKKINRSICNATLHELELDFHS
mgnify:CR=1 FL=1